MPSKYKFLVVAVDYFTKWVEAEPLVTITGKNILKFVWKNIICRFGISHRIISDNGKQFANDPLRANGQVEVTNKTILQELKTRLDPAKGDWVDQLPHVLWSYRTTPRTATAETPCSLTYGTEVVIPAEIG